MTTATQIRLAEQPAGRIYLHLACMFIDGKIKYHSKGILRELTKELDIPTE